MKETLRKSSAKRPRYRKKFTSDIFKKIAVSNPNLAEQTVTVGDKEYTVVFVSDKDTSKVEYVEPKLNRPIVPGRVRVGELEPQSLQSIDGYNDAIHQLELIERDLNLEILDLEKFEDEFDLKFDSEIREINKLSKSGRISS